MNLAIASKIIHGKFTQEVITALPHGYPTTAVAINVRYNYILTCWLHGGT